MAETHFPAQLQRGEAGEEIVLARNSRPRARLVPIPPSPRRRLGFLQGTVDDAFFEPLQESALRAWDS